MSAIRINRRGLSLGRTPDGMRVFVDVRFGPDPLNSPGTVQSTEHATITYPDVLSIVGDVQNPHITRGDASVASGQCSGEVRRINRPAGALTRRDLQRFASLWDRWHLNTMRAACVHMDPNAAPADLSDHDRATWRLENLTCPETGYRYGRSWLAEEVPAWVLAELLGIIDRATAPERPRFRWAVVGGERVRLYLVPGDKRRQDVQPGDVATCGHCRRTWDDAQSTGLTPVPSGRCPFEFHH